MLLSPAPIGRCHGPVRNDGNGELFPMGFRRWARCYSVEGDSPPVYLSQGGGGFMDMFGMMGGMMENMVRAAEEYLLAFHSPIHYMTLWQFSSSFCAFFIHTKHVYSS